MKITDLFVRQAIKRPRGDKTSPQEYRTSFKWNQHAGQMVSGRGGTQEEADAACIEKIRDRFRGTYTPLWLSFRGETMLIWRDGDAWIYGHIRERNEPTSLVIGNWTSRDEAEREARRQLAMATWDEREETSAIITSPDEQRRFRDWTRTQKVHSATYQRLLEIGWTHEEAIHLLSGVDPSAERAQLLGDPWPLIRAMEHGWKGKTDEEESPTHSPGTGLAS